MSSCPILEAPEYSGLRLVMRGQPTSGQDAAAQDEVDDDIEGEKETIDYGGGDDEGGDGDVDDNGDVNSDDGDEEDGLDGRVDEDGDMNGDVKMADLRSVIKEASKGVVDSTDAEYKRYCHLSVNLNCSQRFQGSTNSVRNLSMRKGSSRKATVSSPIHHTRSRLSSLWRGS